METVSFRNLPKLGSVSFFLLGSDMMVSVGGSTGLFRDVLPKMYPTEACALGVCQAAHGLAEQVLRRRSHLRSNDPRGNKPQASGAPCTAAVPEDALHIEMLGLKVVGWRADGRAYINIDGVSYAGADFDPAAFSGDEFVVWSLRTAQSLLFSFSVYQSFNAPAQRSMAWITRGDLEAQRSAPLFGEAA
ncbi:hypothetical protein J2847_005821 [Azospirillum agricola]|uniref:hypothetical protein n=1 Tax=Azospirillum agricola TaxID=1720247 RepID=UPI001AE34F1F|nr:hypothetical protein [Azospirillum agricola]MBP2232492.1 hypothetical protein [Azospirillum agricola]